VSDDTTEHGPEWLPAAFARLTPEVDKDARVVGATVTYRSTDGDLVTVGLVAGEDELRKIMVPNAVAAAAIDDVLVAFTIDLAGPDVTP
jgi:hypothetical protein